MIEILNLEEASKQTEASLLFYFNYGVEMNM